MSKRLRILTYLGLAVILGSVREYLSINLNYQIDHVRRETAFSYAHSDFQALTANWSLNVLLGAKWTLALLLVAVMLVLTIRVSRLLFENKRYSRFLVVGYLTAGSVSLLLFFLSGIHPGFKLAAVQLLHALQFPVIMVMMIFISSLPRNKDSIA
jgi:hypothetical protein